MIGDFEKLITFTESYSRKRGFDRHIWKHFRLPMPMKLDNLFCIMNIGKSPLGWMIYKMYIPLEREQFSPMYEVYREPIRNKKKKQAHAFFMS